MKDGILPWIQPTFNGKITFYGQFYTQNFITDEIERLLGTQNYENFTKKQLAMSQLTSIYKPNSLLSMFKKTL